MEDKVYCSVRVNKSYSRYVSGIERTPSCLRLDLSAYPVPIPRRVADLASDFMDALVDLHLVDRITFVCSNSAEDV